MKEKFRTAAVRTQGRAAASNGLYGVRRKGFSVITRGMLIIMLGGGDKSTQVKDIAAAKALALTIEE